MRDRLTDVGFGLALVAVVFLVTLALELAAITPLLEGMARGY